MKFTSQKKYEKISSENFNHESRWVYIRLLIKHCIKALTHSLRKSLKNNSFGSLKYSYKFQDFFVIQQFVLKNNIRKHF